MGPLDYTITALLFVAAAALAIAFFMIGPQPSDAQAARAAFLVAAGFFSASALLWALAGDGSTAIRGLILLTVVAISFYGSQWLSEIAASRVAPIQRVIAHRLPSPLVPTPAPVELAPAPQRGRQPNRPSEHTEVSASRLAVTRFEFAPPEHATNPGDQGVKIYFRNKGFVPASAPVIAAQSIVTPDTLPDEVIAKLTNETGDGAFLQDVFDADRAQADTDQEYWKWAPGIVVSADDMQSIKDSKKSFYLFFAMTYVDGSLDHKQYWDTVFTTVFRGDTGSYTVLRSKTTLRHAS